jgi:hypothetical protein
LQGDFKDVSKAEIQSLGEEALKDSSVHEVALRCPIVYRSKGIGNYYHDSDVMKAGVASWGSMMGEGQWLGDLLRSRETVVVLGKGMCKTLFVHAGININILQVCAASTFPRFTFGFLRLASWVGAAASIR